MNDETITASLTLTTATRHFLASEAATAGVEFDQFISRILNELCSPDQEEALLIDELLVSASSYFPPIMTLEEREDFREEILDYLLTRISIMFEEKTGHQLTEPERMNLANRLSQQAPYAWGP